MIGALISWSPGYLDGGIPAPALPRPGKLLQDGDTRRATAREGGHGACGQGGWVEARTIVTVLLQEIERIGSQL